LIANPLVLRSRRIHEGASEMKRFLVEACQNVCLMKIGDKENVSAATKQNRSSFLNSRARKYVPKTPIRPRIREIQYIDPSRSIPVLEETPAAKNGYALGYDSGYKPIYERGCRIHFP
jgi:hypothetical protein